MRQAAPAESAPLHLSGSSWQARKDLQVAGTMLVLASAPLVLTAAAARPLRHGGVPLPAPRSSHRGPVAVVPAPGTPILLGHARAGGDGPEPLDAELGFVRHRRIAKWRWVMRHEVEPSP